MTVQTKIAAAAADAARILDRLGVAQGLWTGGNRPVRSPAARRGVAQGLGTGGNRPVRSPVSGEVMAHVHDASPAEVAAAVEAAHTAFLAWRTVAASRARER